VVLVVPNARICPPCPARKRRDEALDRGPERRRRRAREERLGGGIEELDPTLIVDEEDRVHRRVEDSAEEVRVRRQRRSGPDRLA
jgi:hypothetical protein